VLLISLQSYPISRNTRFRMFLRLWYRAMQSCILNKYKVESTIVAEQSFFCPPLYNREFVTRQLLNRQFISIAIGWIHDMARQLFYFPLSWRAWSRTARNCCPRSLRCINRSFCRTQHARMRYTLAELNRCQCVPTCPCLVRRPLSCPG